MRTPGKFKSIMIALGVLSLLSAAAVVLAAPSLIDGRMNRISGKPHEVSDKAKELHKKLFIIDLHADSLLWNRDLLVRNKRGHLDVPRMIEGNVAIQAFTIVTKVPRGVNIKKNKSNSDMIYSLSILEGWPAETRRSLKERTLYQASKLQGFAARSDGKFTLIKNASDLDNYLKRRENNPKITAGFLGVEGAHALDGDLNNIDVFYDRGIRMMAPTHFFDNDIGGSAHGEKKMGLTDKGKEMIRHMQEKNMIVDVAHGSTAVIHDVLEVSTKPIVVSHTGVKGTCDNARNLSDNEIRGIAKSGGIIGIGFWKEAVCGKDEKAIARAIRYTADLVGVEHVALGSDYDGAVTVPFDASHLAMLTDALINEKFTDDEIHLIMGRNALRLLREQLPSR